MTLIGAEPEPPYERPPLSKAYLRGDVPFEKALVRPAAFYADHRIDTIFGTRATRIDSAARIVELEDHRQIPFDALLIATGGRNRRVRIPGSDLEGIYSLRTVEDANRIRSRDRTRSPRRRCRHGVHRFGGRGVTPAERDSRWLPSTRRRRRSSACWARRSATPSPSFIGLTVCGTIFEDSVTAFEGTERVSAVVTKGGLRIPCDFVVVGIGIEPAVEMLEGSGIHVDNGVVVDEYL